jgi:hypothetical protein
VRRTEGDMVECWMEERSRLEEEESHLLKTAGHMGQWAPKRQTEGDMVECLMEESHLLKTAGHINGSVGSEEADRGRHGGVLDGGEPPLKNGNYYYSVSGLRRGSCKTRATLEERGAGEV